MTEPKRKRKRKKAKPQLPAAYRPWPVVLLVIDPGKTSGWAIYVRGSLWDWGTCQPFDGEAIGVVAAAKAKADLEALSLRVVLEKWSAGGWASHATLVGLGAAKGAWQSALEHGRVAKSHRVQVHPQRWRSKVTRPRFGAKRPEHVELEQQVAKRIVGNIEIPPDAAAAICIGQWGIRAGEVGKTLPERVQRRCGMEAA